MENAVSDAEETNRLLGMMLTKLDAIEAKLSRIDDRLAHQENAKDKAGREIAERFAPDTSLSRKIID
jgi:hypothetical protein